MMVRSSCWSTVSAPPPRKSPPPPCRITAARWSWDMSTFGKGTVQSLNPLRPFVWPANASATNDPGTVKITIRKFYRVSGA